MPCPVRKNLETRVETLESDYQALKSDCKALKSDFKALNSRLGVLELKYRAISLREIARILERHICLHAAGSKTLARKQLFRLDKFPGSGREGALRKTLESLGLTKDLIDKVKNQGDVVHDNRDILTVSELENLLQKPDFDEDEKKETASFISALHTFGMVQADGLVKVSDNPF